MAYGGYGGGDRPRETFKTTCSDCGTECEVPFKPTEGRPIYCHECFQKHRGEGRASRRDYSDRNRAPRETFTATCADCGTECEVPFKPTEGRPVYCNDCFHKHREDRGPRERRF